MCRSRTNFDVTTGRLQNQRYFQGVYFMYCKLQNHKLCKTMVCCDCVAMNSLEITLILQSARIDVKIGLARAYGNL